ncbi:unnamed protein product [Arctia plantaginis]|uniref:Uncharacterized protein n=1 Tax=Arctia plantaginis TaxID=874455 RepID=A0A8S0Z4R8_ARCPL|nr:unnamed protein product [Arctia plantaginis]
MMRKYQKTSKPSRKERPPTTKAGNVLVTLEFGSAVVTPVHILIGFILKPSESTALDRAEETSLDILCSAKE